MKHRSRVSHPAPQSLMNASVPAPRALSRREFIASSSVAALALALPRAVAQTTPAQAPLIDIHMHQNAAMVSGGAAPAGAKASQQRLLSEFLQHQKILGATTTVFLGANDATTAYAKQEPARWVCFCSQDLKAADAHAKMESSLKQGAIGIGELKSAVACDSPEMIRTAELAKAYNVPMLIHFEEGAWNDGIARFNRVIEKFPTVHFIGHGQSWWTHINKDHKPEAGLYPKGPVTPGGIADRWLADYPNMHADLSAGSGNNAMMRDPAVARDFFLRHQNKIMFGSDCPCRTGVGPTCVSAVKRTALDSLKLGDPVMAKVLRENAKKLLKLKTA